MGAIDAWTLVADAWRAGIQPDAVVQVSEWADDNRVLSRKVAAEPGEWRTARVPYIREVMDCLSVTSPVQDVVFVAGTQVAKSETGMNWLGYAIDRVPSPFLIVLPTLTLAKRWSRQRLAEMVESTPAIRAKAAEKRSRDSANTILEKEFEGGSMVVVTGANSAVGLRSMPARYIHFDEVDAYPNDVDGEGDPIGLASNRQDTFGARAKRLYTSTPTERDASEIEFRYLNSDRRRYHVKCPHCGTEQPLVWSDPDGRRRLVWTDDDPDTVMYLCVDPECTGLIEERHKPDLLAGGRWIAEAPGPNKAAGFWINSLYSPWVRWPALVREFIEAQKAADAGDLAKLKKFWNTRLALTWEQPGDRVKSHALLERAKAETYRLGTVPPGGLVLTGAVDVQPDRLEALIVAWGVGEEAWIVDYRVVYGDTNEEEPWNEMRDIMRTPIRNAWGRDLYVRACAIDTGYNAQRCYAWLRNHEHEGFFGVKGFGEDKRPVLGKRSAQDFNWTGVKVDNGAHIYPIGTFAAKEQLTGWLKLEGKGAHRLHFSPDLNADFFAQLTVERLVTKWIGGKAKREWWKPKAARNEVLDIMVYNMAAAWFIGLPRYRPIQWETLQKNLERDDLFRAVEVIVPAAVEGREPPPVEQVEVPVAAASPVSQPASEAVSAPAPQPVAHATTPTQHPIARPPARRMGSSSYLKRRR